MSGHSPFLAQCATPETDESRLLDSTRCKTSGLFSEGSIMPVRPEHAQDLPREGDLGTNSEDDKWFENDRLVQNGHDCKQTLWKTLLNRSILSSPSSSLTDAENEANRKGEGEEMTRKPGEQTREQTKERIKEQTWIRQPSEEWPLIGTNYCVVLPTKCTFVVKEIHP